MSFYWWFLFIILPIFLVLICISIKKRNHQATFQRPYAVPVTVYTVQQPQSQPQVFVAPVHNNFPHSQHLSPSTQLVEQRLNVHYAQQQAQNAPPPYVNQQQQITITISSGLALFILIFICKQRKNKRRQAEIINATQLVVHAQVPQQQQSYPSAPYAQNYPSANPSSPPPSYHPQQQSAPYPAAPPQYAQPPYPNQQIGFANQPTVFVPQQSPYIPTTSNQGAYNARDPQVYYNPQMPQSTIALHTAPGWRSTT